MGASVVVGKEEWEGGRWNITSTRCFFLRCRAPELANPQARRNLAEALDRAAVERGRMDAWKQFVREARAAMLQLATWWSKDSLMLTTPVLPEGYVRFLLEVASSAHDKFQSSTALATDEVLDIGAYWPWKELNRFFRATEEDINTAVRNAPSGALSHPNIKMGTVQMSNAINLGRIVTQTLLDSGELRPEVGGMMMGVFGWSAATAKETKAKRCLACFFAVGHPRPDHRQGNDDVAGRG